MATFTFTNDTGMAITGGPHTQSLDVYGTLGTITDVNINLTGLVHSWAGDLDMLLIAPDSTTNLEFLSDVGSSSDFNGDYVFDFGSDSLMIENPDGDILEGTYASSTTDDTETADSYGLTNVVINRSDPLTLSLIHI